MYKQKWLRRLLILAAVSMVAVACAWFGGDDGSTAVEAANGGISLTVYNEGTALVRDRRQFDLEEGFNQVSFTEVAASIDATSVLFMSLTDPDGTSVLEQNFEYDLVGTGALLERYLDEEIVVVTTDGTRYSGTLLSGRGDLIIQSPDGQVSVIKLENVQELTFPELPDGLITRPTLVWHLLAERGGAHDVEVTYLTGGINWQADYVLLLSEDEQSIDLDGWITLSNSSGASFVDAQLKLIAGDLQRVAQQRAAGDMDYIEMEESMGAAPVEQREFFEYHLYEIPRPVTVGDNETKQIEFVSVTSVPASKFFVYDGLQCASNYWACQFYGYANTDPSYGIASNPKVMVMVEFDTEQVEADLPRGRVRLYQEDVDGAALLVGEDTIDHTPEGEIVRLYVGDAFDIIGERIQTDFRRPSSNTLEEEFEITIRNHKDEPVDIRIVEHMLRWSEWTILASSDDYTKMDSSTIEFNVTVPANGEVTVTYTVRYRWP
jgi:hypothetical protein